MAKKKQKSLADSLPDGWEVFAEAEDDYKAHKRVDTHVVTLANISEEDLVENVRQWEAAQDRSNG